MRSSQDPGGGQRPSRSCTSESYRTRTERHMFEHSVAAFLRSKGIPALPGKRTDVLLRSQRYTLLFECKRPRSQKGPKQSSKEASEQLQREIKRRKATIFTRGVVASDVSLLIRRPRLLFRWA